MDVRVRGHTSDTASFALAQRAAHPRLRGLVLDYEDFEERSAAPLGRREVAVPHVVVIVDLSGEGWDVAGRDATAFVRHRSFVAGVHDQPTTVRHDGRARCLQLNLTPLGARAVLGVPLAELTNRVVPLEDLLGPAARRLEERLDGAGGWAERFALLDEELLARAAAAAPLRPDVVRAWRRLSGSDGAVEVGALAAELGCSRRHLSSRFGEEVGLPPKTYARLLRFRRASDALIHGGEDRLATVAAACGYSDQSHLNREFRQFAGATPGAIVRGLLPGGAGVAG